jgi:hypothetical protein
MKMRMGAFIQDANILMPICWTTHPMLIASCIGALKIVCLKLWLRLDMLSRKEMRYCLGCVQTNKCTRKLQRIEKMKRGFGMHIPEGTS